MNRQTAEAFFTAEELEQISRAIVAAEAGTSGEIVPLVLARSDEYREAELIAALLLAALLSLVLVLALHHDSVWWFLPALALLFPGCRFLVRHMPYLARPFISRSRAERAVRERAVRVFYEQGLHRTEGATGVLIYISLFERRVWILGDSGINSRIAPDAWQEMVAQLIAGIREGKGGAALCEVILSCGRLLHEHFPATPDNRNELSDNLIVA